MALGFDEIIKYFCNYFRLFPLLPRLMSQHCVGYIVALDENKPYEMCNILKQFGFEALVVKRRKIIGESLSVLKFTRKID